MEERVKTSFIPKASLQVEKRQTKSADPIALANVITGIILVLAILGAGGVFLFQGYTVQNIAAKQQSLERSRLAFEPATIKELSRLNARIETGKVLLKSHVSLSKFFDELEKLTLSSVRFNDFSYTTVSAGKTVFTAKGEAASFNAIALQSDGFSKSDIIMEPIFSNVNIGKDGTIDFDFTAIIDTSRIGYTPMPIQVQPALQQNAPSIPVQQTP